MSTRKMFAMSCLASAVCAANAAAQTEGQASQDAQAAKVEARKEAREKAIELEEVLVTGTYIHGVKSAGSNTISLDQVDMETTGVMNTAQLLATRPETGMLNTTPATRPNRGAGFTLNRPDIRGLQTITGAASSTLMILDGHRMPSMGIIESGPDADVLPIGAVERVEIITDGGSAIYGADAVGGVVNYITRKRFDGADFGVRTGFADEYEEFGVNFIIGKDMEWGSAYLAYSFTNHSDIMARDRDYIQETDWVSSQSLGTKVGSVRLCEPGTVSAGGINYALPNLTTDALNLGNRCDYGDYSSYPEETKNQVFTRITLDNGGPISFTLPIFYMDRENGVHSGQQGESNGWRVSSDSGSYIDNPSAPAEERIYVGFGSNIGDSARNTLETYGFTPTLNVDFGNDWRLNVLANWGKSESEIKNQSLNPEPINAAIAAGTFDFLDISSPANTDALALAGDWYDYAKGTNEIENYRAVLDGPLFKMPWTGGIVRAALGAEYSDESYELQQDASVSGAGISSLPKVTAERDVTAYFAELSIPLIEEGNSDLFHSLTLSVAGRYDDYSDFGDTTNMRYAIDFEPLEWLRLRANTGTSFQAPALSDIALGTTPSGRTYPAFLTPLLFSNPNVPLEPGSENLTYIVTGTALPILPQEADILSLGFDVQVPGVDGLSFGSTYYEIEFKDQIGNPPLGTNSPQFYELFPQLYTNYSEGDAAMEAARDAALAVITNPESFTNDLSDYYVIADARKQNLGIVEVEGVDFYVRYLRETGWGNWFVNFAANRPLENRQAVSKSAPFVETDVGPSEPRLMATTSIGASFDRYRAQLNWSHSGGYDLDPNPAALNQDEVDAYDVFNFNLLCDLKGLASWTENMNVSINVDNITDEDPPLDRSNPRGFSNGNTLGRLLRLGVQMTF